MANKHAEQIMQYIKDSKKKEQEYVLLSELLTSNGDSLTQDTKSKIQKILSGGSYVEKAIASVVEKFDPTKIGTFEVVTHENVEMSCALPMENFPYEEIGDEQFLILHTENGVMIRKISQCSADVEGCDGRLPITSVEYMWLDASKWGVKFKNSLAYESTEIRVVGRRSNTTFGYYEGYKNNDGLWDFHGHATNEEEFANYSGHNDWYSEVSIRMDDFINCNPSIRKRINDILNGKERPRTPFSFEECARDVVKPCLDMQETFNTIAREMGVSEELITDITGKNSKAYVENLNVM